jgi:hypothetical protein
MDCSAHPGFKISWDEKFVMEKHCRIYGTKSTFSNVKIFRDCPHCKIECLSEDEKNAVERDSAKAKHFNCCRRSLHLCSPILSLPEPPAPPMTQLMYFGGMNGRNNIVKQYGAGQRLTIQGGPAIYGVKIGKVQYGSPVGAILADCLLPASGRFRLYSVDMGSYDGCFRVICGLRFSVDGSHFIDVSATNCRGVTRKFQKDGGLEVQIRSICSDSMLEGITFLCFER